MSRPVSRRRRDTVELHFCHENAIPCHENAISLSFLVQFPSRESRGKCRPAVRGSSLRWQCDVPLFTITARIGGEPVVHCRIEASQFPDGIQGGRFVAGKTVGDPFAGQASTISDSFAVHFRHHSSNPCQSFVVSRAMARFSHLVWL